MNIFIWWSFLFVFPPGWTYFLDNNPSKASSAVSTHVCTLHMRAVIHHLGCQSLMQPEEININSRAKMGGPEGKRIKDLWCLCTRTSRVLLAQVLQQLLSIAVLQENQDMPGKGLASPGRALYSLCLLCTKDTAWSKGKWSKLSMREILYQWAFISHINFFAGTPGHLLVHSLPYSAASTVSHHRIMTMWQ